ncbi:hypothetical protein C2845_PM01G40940 [Panicum miliaceum]|uniref:Uncharacterized protein n=1 Tax=Panicum miliaceum TaxID=4540 RepID=A0A3L6TNH1_PANMI|nr:hypothetical protein C2845_PM01G40940 [Panicum miliaceum]
MISIRSIRSLCAEQWIRDDLYVKDVRPQLRKLDDRSSAMIFIGYDERVKGYRAYNPVNMRVHVTRDAIFDEEASWDWEAGGAALPCSDFIITEVEQAISPAPVAAAGGPGSPASAPPAVMHATSASPTPSMSPSPPPLTPAPTTPPAAPEFVSPLANDDERVDASHEDTPLRYRVIDNVIGDALVPGQAARDLDDEALCLVCEGEPSSFAEAEHDAAWRAAMKEEMEAVERNDTWELVDLPRGHRPIGLRWVFKLKKNEAGAVIKHKARLVAKGHVQKPVIDFDEVFAPVARMESVRLLLALAAHEGWPVHHMDVKLAFLNGVLEEEVYVTQPPGFIVPGQEGKVLRLKKALYGLRQAPRAWNVRLDATLKNLGFEQSAHEHAVYGHGHGGARLLIGVYVDDLVITGSNPAEINRFKDEMKAQFLMSDLGLLSFYLGIEMRQNARGIALNQRSYAARILDTSGMKGCNPTSTPMEEWLRLSHESMTEEVDATAYRRIIGSLRYLVHTRPDLALSVGYVSRFMERPTVEHMGAVKRLLCYIADTIDYGLIYPRGLGETKLVGYSDSDLAGDIDTRESTSGALFFLGASLISWQSTKQRILALSSCEAEYVAATMAASQAIWLARLLSDLKGKEAATVKLKMDNMSALALSKNPVFHERSKHIDVRYHFIRDCLENGSISAEFVSTKDQLADILTKVLGRVRFHELNARIGLVKIQDEHKDQGENVSSNPCVSV